jgi:hypothetical protein
MRNKILCILPVIALAVGCAPATTSSPTPLPAETSAPSAAPPSVAAAARPALTETFSSTLHGISVAYPEGWVPRAATEPWPADDFVQQDSLFGDVIEDGSSGDTAFLAVASKPLAGLPLERFVAGYGPFTECGSPEPIVVDGAPGIVGTECPMALVTAGDRVFLIWLYRIDDPEWFQEILATVQLNPETALDTAP